MFKKQVGDSCKAQRFQHLGTFFFLETDSCEFCTVRWKRLGGLLNGDLAQNRRELEFVLDQEWFRLTNNVPYTGSYFSP